MTKRDEAHLLSGAYALDVATSEEAALVESAMQESEELRSEVVGMTDTAVALGLGIQPVSPPPALRARLLDLIDTTPQLAAESSVEPEAQPAAAMPAGSHVVPRRRRRRRPAALLALAATAVVLFGGVFLVQRTVLMPESALAPITSAADVQKDSSRIAGGGTATVYWSKSKHSTAVVLAGVKVPSGKVLQLWSIRGKSVTDAGLYENGSQYTLIPGTPSAGEDLAVSVEPMGGSAHPTTVPIVRVDLNA